MSDRFYMCRLFCSLLFVCLIPNADLDVADRVRSDGVYEYVISSDWETWETARTQCADKGWSLVTIRNERENAVIKSFVIDFRYELWIGLSTNCGCYVTSATECSECRSQLRWHDGTENTYEQWFSYEPGYYGDCARFGQYGWIGTICSSSYHYVCRRHLCHGFNCEDGNGRCHVEHGTALCQCNPGFTGSSCETNINDCFDNFCQNEGACIDGINNYLCNCTVGFYGDYCEEKEQTESKGKSEKGPIERLNTTGLIIGLVFGVLLAVTTGIGMIFMIIIYRKQSAELMLRSHSSYRPGD